MRPLTDHTPKPLLQVGGKSLIRYLVEALVKAGLHDLVLNHSYLGEQIITELGDGRVLGARIIYSAEPEGALETGGGMLRALPLMGTGPFVAVNADIWTDYPFGQLPDNPPGLAHLVLVDNPAHHPHGDFVLKGGRVFDLPVGNADGGVQLTFSGIGVYRPALFANCAQGRFPLAPVLRSAMARGEVTGEHYRGRWVDIGTPERLADLNRELSRTVGASSRD